MALAKNPAVQKLPIAAILNFDPETGMNTQSREKISLETVNTYAELLTEGTNFPPIEVFYDGNQYWLADGWHRIEANKKVGFKEIDAKVFKGTAADAIKASLGANTEHGLPRSNQDKRNAVLMAFQLMQKQNENWSDVTISETCRVSSAFVGNMRKTFGIDSEGKRLGKDGKEYKPGATAKAADKKAKDDAKKDADYAAMASVANTQGPLDDAVKVEVPDHLRVVFGVSRSMILGKIKGMRDLREEISDTISVLPREPETVRLIDGDKDMTKAFNAAMRDLESNFVPHAVCPYCKGRKVVDGVPACRGCGGSGWLTREQYKLVPERVVRSLQTAEEMGYWDELDAAQVAKEEAEKKAAEEAKAKKDEGKKAEGKGMKRDKDGIASDTGVRAAPKPSQKNGVAKSGNKGAKPKAEPKPQEDIPF